jgi:hypothetical protein
MFPDNGAPILWQHESAIVLDASKGSSFFEVNTWGMLFYGAHVWVESNQFTGISLSGFLGHVLLFIGHAGRMIQLLGYSGAITIELTLDPIRRIDWLHQWHGFPQNVPGSELDNEVTLTIPTSAEAML